MKLKRLYVLSIISMISTLLILACGITVNVVDKDTKPTKQKVQKRNDKKEVYALVIKKSYSVGNTIPITTMVNNVPITNVVHTSEEYNVQIKYEDCSLEIDNIDLYKHIHEKDKIKVILNIEYKEDGSINKRWIELTNGGK